eukprot:s1218_g16.t1
MTAFIEGFADSKAEEERKIKEKQESIERLLQNISKSLDLPTDVTPESHLRDMEDELDFKSRQLQNSETTQSRLEGELAKREGELEKIESLDVKISLELSQVEEKMKQYEKEMAERYDKIEDMKAQGALELQKLEESKRNLEDRERSVALRQQVNFIRLRYDSKRQQLQDDETAANLEGYETKIRQFGQTLHTLRTFILQKTSESDFRAEMASCLDVAGQLNKMLQDSALRPPPPVVPFLPQWLRNDLLSERFVTECVTFFQDLDKDKNGTLEPEELFPMVRSMADAHSMALDLDQCKRFSQIFDVNGDGLIELDEFVNFSRFMIVMSFLHSQEGQLTLSIAMEPEARWHFRQ